MILDSLFLGIHAALVRALSERIAPFHVLGAAIHVKLPCQRRLTDKKGASSRGTTGPAVSRCAVWC